MCTNPSVKFVPLGLKLKQMYEAMDLLNEHVAEVELKNVFFETANLFNLTVDVAVETDEGVTPCTAEGLAKLRPVQPEGIHTFGSQTHRADGNMGVIVTTRDKAKELSAEKTTISTWPR